MFRLARPDETYEYPLTVQVPTDGGTEPQRCTVRFRLLPASEAKAVAAEGDAALAARVLAGWSDIHDPDGQPLPVTDEAKATLLDIPYFQHAVILAYFRFAAGLPEKNSAAPPAIS